MLSIIVPVYNAEKYLEKGLNSILSQTYTDIQLILVDDGSTDLSGDICDRMAQIDVRVVVLHTANCGPVSARITGIEHAGGEYVTFADADDWINENMYFEMMPRLIDSDSDFITSGMIIEDQYKDIITDGLEEGTYNQSNAEYLGLAMWNYTNGKCGILPALCNKIFKKVYLERIFSSIDSSMTLGEDRAIIYTSLLASRRFIITHNAYYHYRIHKESLCHDTSKAGFEQVWKMWKFMKDYFVKNGVYDSVKDSFERNIQEVLAVAERNVYGITSENYVFPFAEIPNGCKIIIYGLGVVGRSYCKYLFLTGYAKIIAIADKALCGKSYYGISVIDISDINSFEYDCILIANLRKTIAGDIREALLDAGISADKIKWVKPVTI